MSTRSATIIYEEEKRFERGENWWEPKEVGAERHELARFYRHCDGYPEGHGLHMARSFAECDKGNLNNRNWFQVYFGPFMCGLHDDWGAPDIEFEWGEVVHGDLDYLYTVTAKPDCGAGKHGSDGESIEIACYRIGWDESYETAMLREPVFCGTPEQWVERYGD